MSGKRPLYGLYPGAMPAIHREYHDIDYAGSLPEEAREWLSRFMEETIHTRFLNDGDDIHRNPSDTAAHICSELVEIGEIVAGDDGKKEPWRHAAFDWQSFADRVLDLFRSVRTLEALVDSRRALYAETNARRRDLSCELRKRRMLDSWDSPGEELLSMDAVWSPGPSHTEDTLIDCLDAARILPEAPGDTEAGEIPPSHVPGGRGHPRPVEGVPDPGATPGASRTPGRRRKKA